MTSSHLHRRHHEYIIIAPARRREATLDAKQSVNWTKRHLNLAYWCTQNKFEQFGTFIQKINYKIANYQKCFKIT